jgi:hypothetical protein
MVKRKPQKPPEGAKLPESAEMKAWREEFEGLKTEDHIKKLAALGLDEEELEEFKEMESGVPVDEEIMTEPVKEKKTKKKIKKK